MLHHVATFLLAIDEHEPNKTPFYLGGGVLALWAVFLGFIGLRSDDFPGTDGAARAVMGVSAIFVVVAIATALITA
jgi:hypothetical protein